MGAIRGRLRNSQNASGLNDWGLRSLPLKLPALARPARRDSVEHALYAYVFVNLRPAYPSTAADDLESCTLVGSCLGEPPGPHQRNTNRPAVHQLGGNRVLGNRNSLNTSLDVSRNAHAKPPKSFPGKGVRRISRRTQKTRVFALFG